jgi:hypothetical protein
MLVDGQLAEVRGLAHLPQPQQMGLVADLGLDVVAGGQLAQHDLVQGLVRQLQPVPVRRPRQRAHQVGEGGEIQPRRAPFGPLHRLEAMGLHRLHQILVHLVAIAGDAESAVALIAARPPGDLAHLLRIEVAHALAVELAQAREGHMVHVHVQPHADGVGGHQKIHLARLIKRHLGVAGAGTQAPHHHRGAAPLAADQLGDRVDLVGAEGDHGGAPGQAGQLLGAGVGQGGEAFAALDLGLGQQAPDQGRHGPRAQEQGLEPAPGVQQALGEHVAALRIGAQLDLVHRQEFHLQAQRHGLHGAHIIVRPGRDDLLLAGDEGHRPGAPQLDDPVVDFPGQQPQGQADHARGVAQHALHGKMRLAGVGRTQNRDQPGGGRAGGTIAHDPNLGDRARCGKPRIAKITAKSTG